MALPRNMGSMNATHRVTGVRKDGRRTAVGYYGNMRDATEILHAYSGRYRAIRIEERCASNSVTPNGWIQLGLAAQELEMI